MYGTFGFEIEHFLTISSDNPMKIKIFSTKLQINSDKFKRDAIMYLEQLPQSLRRKEGKDSIMGIKIGINGFGRIGRVVMRILAEDPEKFEVCGINLRKADIDYMVYLLKYDSVFRNFPGMIEHAGGVGTEDHRRGLRDHDACHRTRLEAKHTGSDQ
jgi:hypothetical protein